MSAAVPGSSDERKSYSVDSPRVAYAPHTDATAEGELNALGNIYKFVLDCRAKKKAAPEGRPNNARKDQDAGTYP